MNENIADGAYTRPSSSTDVPAPKNRSLKQSKGNTGSASADGFSHPSSWKVPMVNKKDSQIF